jgi:hypothetical protein
MLLLPPGSAIPARSTRGHPLASAHAGRPPNTILMPKVSAPGLRPVHLRGPNPRRVICYDFFKGWLLLSLPPRCLRITTPFDLSLSQDLGALTLVWVVPLPEI